VNALVVGFAGRDPFAWLHSGGALQLEFALCLGVGIGESATVAARRLDLVRAVRFRPLREADRVALRRTDWFRDWVDHPERDAFWESLCAELPDPPPPTLMIAGWHDPALGAQLRDCADVAGAARACGTAAPELVIGPWGATPLARRERTRGTRRIATGLRATLAFLDRHLRDAPGGTAPVRAYVRGADAWREAPAWPPPPARPHSYYLRSGGGAPRRGDDGYLSAQPPDADESPDAFVYDPADTVPSCGGVALVGPSGPVDQREVERRGDVLCYTGDPLAADLEIVGPVRVQLYADSDASNTDFTAKLVEVGRDGAARNLCEGIARRHCDRGREPGHIEPFEIDLWAAGARIRAGARLRVEISSSNFPRFDRNPNTKVEPGRAEEADLAPARQTIYHDAARPSHLVLHTLPY
jgi:putative CocE/NonD family hydrolase